MNHWSLKSLINFKETGPPKEVSQWKIFYCSKIENLEDVLYSKTSCDKDSTLINGLCSWKEELDITKLKEEIEDSLSKTGLDKKLKVELLLTLWKTSMFGTIMFMKTICQIWPQPPDTPSILDGILLKHWICLVNSDQKDGIDFSIMKSIMINTHKLKYKKLMILFPKSISKPLLEELNLNLKSLDLWNYIPVLWWEKDKLSISKNSTLEEPSWIIKTLQDLILLLYRESEENFKLNWPMEIKK